MTSTKLGHREHKKSSCDVIKSLSQLDLLLTSQMLWNYIAVAAMMNINSLSFFISLFPFEVYSISKITTSNV